MNWKEFSRFAGVIGAIDSDLSSGSALGGGCRVSDIDTIFIIVNTGGVLRGADDTMDDDVRQGYGASTRRVTSHSSALRSCRFEALCAMSSSVIDLRRRPFHCDCFENM